MFQIDLSLEKQSTYKKFPLREPLRRNYQTNNTNPLNKKDLSFSCTLQKPIKIPLNFSKLYQKKTTNIIVHHHSLSVNTSTRTQQPAFIMRTINLKTKMNDYDEQKLSQRNLKNKKQYNSIEYDSSDNSDYHELRRSYFQKYQKQQTYDIYKPRFRIHSVNDEGIAPWKVDK